MKLVLPPPESATDTAAIKAIQQVMCYYRNRPEDPSESLWSMFRRALQDDYERHCSKTARNYPRKNHRERTGVPHVTDASRAQIEMAREINRIMDEFRLPA